MESLRPAHRSLSLLSHTPVVFVTLGVEALYAFVTLVGGQSPSTELRKELAKHVGEEIGPIARPDRIQFAEALPKTRCGKVMRRILKAIAEGRGELGDTRLPSPTRLWSLAGARGHGLLPREDHKEPRQWLTKRARAEELLNTVEAALASSPV